MKILGITDIHGRTDFDKSIINVLSDVDLIIIAGDITNFGGKKEALDVLKSIKLSNENILAVPGNCDRYDVLDVLKQEGICLHNEVKEFNGLVFFGIGGSHRTPFNTPQEYSDEEMETILKTYKKRIGLQIFVSHAPPLNTKVDKTLLGIHAGSRKIREFIEKNEPDLCLCGHIHESRNIDKIGKTLIVNPGPFPRYYALIEIKKQIQINLIG